MDMSGLKKNGRNTLKIVIAGSRTITDIAALQFAIDRSDFPITEVVSGCARGVDTLGEQWANSEGVPVSYWPANWARFGRAAGKYRNSEMAAYADGAIVLWDGDSRGTLDMIDRMRRCGKPVEVWMKSGDGFLLIN